MEKTIRKTVFKYSGLTAAALLLLMAISFTFVSIFFPKLVADFAYDLSLKNLALYYYEKNYERSNDINDLYGVITLSITLSEHENVIKYYEMLEKNERYDEFITFVNQSNKQLNVNLILKSKLINENNSLKNAYVHALIKTEKWEEAALYASRHFEEYETYSLTSQGVYAFTQLFTNAAFRNENVVNTLTQHYLDTDVSLVNHIVNYFNNIYNEFLQLNETTSQQNYIYYVALQQTANIVASDIGYFNSLANFADANITAQELEEKIFDINDRVRSVIFSE